MLSSAPCRWRPLSSNVRPRNYPMKYAACPGIPKSNAHIGGSELEGPESRSHAAPEGPANAKTGTGSASAGNTTTDFWCQPRWPSTEIFGSPAVFSSTVSSDSPREIQDRTFGVSASKRAGSRKLGHFPPPKSGPKQTASPRWWSRQRAQVQQRAAWPNPSLKRSANGMSRRPSSAGPAAHFALAVQRAMPSSPA